MKNNNIEKVSFVSLLKFAPKIANAFMTGGAKTATGKVLNGASNTAGVYGIGSTLANAKKPSLGTMNNMKGLGFSN